MTQGDEELWKAYCAGDNQAFAGLVHRYTRELFVFLVRFVNDAALAEDLVQDTFMQVHTARESFDTERRFRPWLYAVAANKARDRLRQIKRRPERLVGDAEQAGSEADSSEANFFDWLSRIDAPPHSDMQSHETAEQVRGVLSDMPQNLREILLFAYFHQFPYQDISTMLEIPVGTVKSRVHAAVRWFAQRWKQTQGDGVA